MKKFVRIFILQLKWMLLIGMAATIAALIYNHFDSKYEVLDRDAFLTISKEKNIREFEFFNDRVIFKTPDGKKYGMPLTSWEESGDIENILDDRYENHTGPVFSHYPNISNALLFVLYVWFFFFFILALNLTLVFWLVVLYDLLKSEFSEKQNKWIWLVCLFLVPLITPIFYYFISGKQKVI